MRPAMRTVSQFVHLYWDANCTHGSWPRDTDRVSKNSDSERERASVMDDPGTSTAKHPAVRAVLTAGVLALAVVNGTSVGTAAATSVQVTLQFNCSSVYGDVPMTAVVQASAPASATVGVPTPAVELTASVTADSPVIGIAIGATGATSVEGGGKAVTTATSAQGKQSKTVQMVIPETPIADSDEVTVKAFGTFPPVTYTRPGTATIAFTSLQGQVIPIAGNGSEPVGPIAISCTLAAGNGVLYSLPVLAALASSGAPQPGSTSPSPTTHGASPTTRGPSPTTHGPSPTTVPPSSGSASPTGTGTTRTSDPASAGSTSPVGSVSGSAGVSGSTTPGRVDAQPTSSSTLVMAVSAGTVVVLGTGTALFLRRRRRH